MNESTTDAQASPLPLLPRLRTALFDIAAREPEHAPRWTLRAIAALFGALLIWSLCARLDIVAVAEGRLVPESYVKIVQPADAGIVREILVKEGERVAAGQVLVRLDPTENAADSTAVERDLAAQRLQLRRIDAELAGQPMTSRRDDDPVQYAEAQAQYRAHRQSLLDALAQERQAGERADQELVAARATERKLERTLPSYERTAAAYEKLATRQLVGTIQAEEQRRLATEQAQDLAAQQATVASLEAAVGQSGRRAAQLRSAYESDLHARRVDTVQKVTQLEQQQAKLAYRQQNLELRAPQAGTVKELATTTVGAVVQPGTVLLSLVPVDEPLRAEVAVQNQDIGFVRTGQQVRLKLATYPFQKYGMVDGTVQTVMADASASSPNGAGASATDTSSPPAYKAIITLAGQDMKTRGVTLPLAAGMQLTAEIVEDQRTVMEYLLSPVQRIASEAGRER
ncbi:MAG: HlyD family type I secretion periplasmic adaptor subunit [Gammaproteobacteria bacterium]|nr:HlyD family type I secretion periplasmic adaptor subunit [Gammaproteobacteria bacterium]